MVGRLLSWQKHGDVYHTYSDVASAIVYPYDNGYHWEVFVGDACSWHGQVDSLVSAINHVEGNFVGRDLQTDLTLRLQEAC